MGIYESKTVLTIPLQAEAQGAQKERLHRGTKPSVQSFHFFTLMNKIIESLAILIVAMHIKKSPDIQNRFHKQNPISGKVHVKLLKQMIHYFID
ncbi:hypothetical protein CAGA_17300 [Caproiciproducens galactitolivorans]|uniref:Uncharacterized protein n=1 Tax=Caproiciproducens galactitolivorans TaxID=642589 RepID=A0A4Z0YEW1_9FIRM|nr:hypothetical protein CAGA_17300 [Caproiciproducens galactitolivorans]